MHQKQAEDKATDNLFQIAALARVIIEKSNLEHNRRADDENYTDEEATFLADLERFSEMILEKVEQVHTGVFD